MCIGRRSVAVEHWIIIVSSRQLLQDTTHIICEIAIIATKAYTERLSVVYNILPYWGVDLWREGIKRKQLATAVAAIPVGNNCSGIPEKGESWRKQQILIKLFIFIGNNNGICLNFENITSVLSRIRKTHGRTKIGKL